MRSYYLRLVGVALVLAALTAAVALLGPRPRAITVVARAPEGDAVPGGTTIRLTFSGPVDRAAAERSFALDPPVPGRFIWDAQTMVFAPDVPLAPDTTYRVALGPGLRDLDGTGSLAPLDWQFRTRAPRLLVLAGDAAGGARLLLADPAGGEPRILRAEPDGITGFALSPDGTRLVYAALSPDGRSRLMLLGLADTTLTPLVDDPQISAAAPAWSPDGRLIAFEWRRMTDGMPGVPRIWLAQPDGTALGPLYSGDEVTFGGSWAPGGRRLAFIDGNAEVLGIFQFHNSRQSFPQSTGEPATWAPDGARLVYTGFSAATRETELRLANVADGSVTTLPTGPGARNPAWAPGAEQLVYARRDERGPGSSLWLLEIGGQPRRLTEPGTWADLHPAWSPDGRQLAFVRLDLRRDALAPEIYVVAADGATAPTRIIPGNLAVWVP